MYTKTNYNIRRRMAYCKSICNVRSASLSARQCSSDWDQTLTMSLGGSPHEDGENELAMNAATQVRTFKYVAMAVLLLITIVSALVPLWISSHGTATSRNALRSKLPFVTAGVFLGSGLMHLLPDASEMYTQMLERMDSLDQTPWLVEFPLVHLLCCLGCTIVWSVDLLNLGDSGKMMAVATAARPNCTCSLRVYVIGLKLTVVCLQVEPVCVACNSRLWRSTASTVDRILWMR